MHHPTDRIVHTTAFVTPVVEHWLERVFYLMMHSMVIKWQCRHLLHKNKGRKEMFYLRMHSTHFILQYYGVRDMVKYHTDSERGNPLLPHGLLFLISSKGSFICIIPQTG